MHTKLIIMAVALAATSVSGAPVGEVLGVIETPGPCPTGLAFDGTHLWLADAFTDKLYAIEPGTGKVVREFTTPGHHPVGLAWGGKTLWHTDKEEPVLYQLDPQTGAAVKVLESCTSDPQDIAWDGTHLWVADAKKDVIMKVSAKDGMAVDFFTAPVKETTGLTYDGMYLWVADRLQDRIYLVHPKDGMCISSLRSYGPFPTGLAWGKQALWNVDYENRQIYKIRVFGDTVLSRWDKRTMALHYIKEFRNYGPGTVDALKVWLPVPEERANQHLLGSVAFDSMPAEMIRDSWDQMIAEFSYRDLAGYRRVRAGWRVTADIYAIEYFLYPERIGTLADIPPAIKKTYLADSEKYLIHDPYIEKLADRIVGQETNPYWVARRVLEYLTKNLSYNLKPIGGWNPAPMVLKRGTGSCSEYSFCMISLCRNRGAPIRYVGAVSRRGDDGSVDDVFHRWVEVYLPPYGWVPFDANKADKGLPGLKVLGVGNVSARYIITTSSSGGGRHLKYNYNYGYEWSGQGQCHIHEENYGLWSPVGEKKYHKPEEAPH